MSANVILDIDVQPCVYETYKALAPAVVEAHGGRYLARAGRTETLKRVWAPKRLVILELDTIERAQQWLDSPDYRAVKQIRHRTAHSNIVVIEGVSAQAGPSAQTAWSK